MTSILEHQDERSCSRCGVKAEKGRMLDYCAICSGDLCPKCLQEGCCANAPAWSGLEHDIAAIEAMPDEKGG